MGKNTKRSKFLIIFVTVLYLAVYWFSGHTISWKYNDRKILGHHIEEVRERYGEFDYECSYDYYYFLYEDSHGIMPSHQNMYYVMIINEDGIVEKITKHGPPGG